jgi:uncharacterized protein (DUF302 family)
MILKNKIQVASLLMLVSSLSYSNQDNYQLDKFNWNNNQIQVQPISSNQINKPKTYTPPRMVEYLVKTTLVDKGITAQEVDESIVSMATNESILHVAMFPIGKQVESVRGKPFRHLSIHNICDANTAAEMADYDDRYTVVLPCRISVVEGKDGRIRMFSLNNDIMNLMNLPPALLKLAKMVGKKMDAIIEGAKEGSF